MITALVAFVILCTIIEFYNINYDRTTAKNNLKLGNVMFQHDLIMKPNLFLYSFSIVWYTHNKDHMFVCLFFSFIEKFHCRVHKKNAHGHFVSFRNNVIKKKSKLT